jgi:hypothetical protein
MRIQTVSRPATSATGQAYGTTLGFSQGERGVAAAHFGQGAASGASWKNVVVSARRPIGKRSRVRHDSASMRFTHSRFLNSGEFSYWVVP